MNTLNEIYPKQPKPIGVGSFLKAPDGELFMVARNHKPNGSAEFSAGLVSLQTGFAGEHYVKMPESELVAISRENVEKMLGDTLDGWLVLSREEAAMAMANND